MCNRILLLFLSTLLVSCATFNAPLDVKLDSSAGKGVAVFSLTSKGALSNFNINFRAVSGETDGEITQWTLVDTLDWEGAIKGRLVTLELPEGDYELYKLRAPYISSKDNFSIPFTVAAGKVVYFGNVDVVFPTRSFFAIKVTEKSDRDLELLLNKYKNLSNDGIVTSISSFNKGA